MHTRGNSVLTNKINNGEILVNLHGNVFVVDIIYFHYMMVVYFCAMFEGITPCCTRLAHAYKLCKRIWKSCTDDSYVPLISVDVLFCCTVRYYVLCIQTLYIATILNIIHKCQQMNKKVKWICSFVTALYCTCYLIQDELDNMSKRSNTG